MRGCARRFSLYRLREERTGAAQWPASASLMLLLLLERKLKSEKLKSGGAHAFAARSLWSLPLLYLHLFMFIGRSNGLSRAR